MYSKLSTFSYMGMLSNPEMFLSDKDFEEAMEFNFLVRPTLEFSNGSSQISHSDEDDDGDHQHQQEEEREEIEEREEKCRIEIPSLEIKLPSLGEFKNVDEEEEEEEEEEEDGLRTPTSLDQRIPLIPTCPPAPRKPKSIPLSSSSSSSTTTTTKRKILLDSSKEIESLFPPSSSSSFVADLGGGKIKKVRECH